MTSEQYDVVFEESQDDDEEPSSSDNDIDDNDDALNDEEDDELLEEEDINSPSLLPQPIAAAVSSASIPAVPLAVASVTTVTIAAVPTDESPPDSKRQRIDSAAEEKKPPPPQQLDDSRRLFQRLWTDEDEIELLQGFLDFSTSKTNSNSSSSHHHHYDTALFYDQIKSKLQLDFNKNQLVEKLRRLKKKYRNVTNKISSGKDFSFKSPHDQATFEISRKIWNNCVVKVEDNVLDDENNSHVNLIDESGEKKNFTPKSTATKKRSRSRGGKMEEKRILNDEFVITSNNFNNRNNNDNGNVDGFGGGGGGGNVAGVIEETVKSFLTPLFKELLGSVIGGGGGGGGGISGLAMNAMPLSFGGSLNFGGGAGGNGELMDERWRKQQILELQVYSKRLELVQDQIKAALEELR